MAAFKSLKFGRLTAGLILCALLTGCAGYSEDQGAGFVPWPPPPSKSRGLDAFPAWSPDGETVAFYSQEIDSTRVNPRTYLRTIDLNTGKVTTIMRVDGLILFNISWSPDSRWLLISSSTGISKMLATGDSLTHLKLDGMESGVFYRLAHEHPEWGTINDALRERNVHSVRKYH